MDCLRMHGRETEKGTSHAPLSFTSLILSRARRRRVHAEMRRFAILTNTQRARFPGKLPWDELPRPRMPSAVRILKENT
jgi:hypothetical protein